MSSRPVIEVQMTSEEFQEWKNQIRAEALREAKEWWRNNGWTEIHGKYRVQSADESAQSVVLWLRDRADQLDPECTG